jgi:hypothetical protein
MHVSLRMHAHIFYNQLLKKEKSCAQGYATGDLNKDAFSVRYFADDLGLELMVTQSVCALIVSPLFLNYSSLKRIFMMNFFVCHM